MELKEMIENNVMAVLAMSSAVWFFVSPLIIQIFLAIICVCSTIRFAELTTKHSGETR